MKTSLSRLPLRGVALALLAPALLVWIAYFTLPDSRLRVSFLDVGQGDAILIQQGSRQILVDGGPDPQRLVLALDRRLPFWDRSLDGVVLTQPQADHMAGLIDVLRRYKVGWVMESGVPSTTEGYKEWRRLVAEKHIPPFEARAGQKIPLGSLASIEVLHPQQDFLKDTGEDVNNNSIVLRLEAGEVSFLLTADIQLEAEQELLFSSARLRSTVLKVAHHGSVTSTSAAFLAVVQPQVTVISLAADNSFGHPAPQVMDRLTQMLGQNRILLTSERGDIDLITDGNRLWVKTER